MAFFALAALPSRLCRHCLCFTVAANGSRSCSAISLRSLPLRLCRCCTCIPLVLRCRSKWLALALCRQLAFFALAASPSWLCRRCLCFAVEANGSCSRFAASLGYTAVACSTTLRHRSSALTSLLLLCPRFVLGLCPSSSLWCDYDVIYIKNLLRLLFLIVQSR
jgi:hypothetical protein